MSHEYVPYEPRRRVLGEDGKYVDVPAKGSPWDQKHDHGTPPDPVKPIPTPAPTQTPAAESTPETSGEELINGVRRTCLESFDGNPDTPLLCTSDELKTIISWNVEGYDEAKATLELYETTAAKILAPPPGEEVPEETSTTLQLLMKLTPEGVSPVLTGGALLSLAIGVVWIVIRGIRR